MAVDQLSDKLKTQCINHHPFAMSFSEINLEPSKLLSAVNDNLNQCFFACSRAEAKQLFHTIAEGASVPFIHIGTQTKGEVVMDLQLDHSEFIGKLTFSQFRKSLAMMMLSVKHRIDEKMNMNPMVSNTGDMLFNIPGVLEETHATNVIVCGISQLGPGKVALKLMYLNPDQYIKAASDVATKVSESGVPQSKAKA